VAPVDQRDRRAPALDQGLTGLRGQITHVLLKTTDWDLPQPRRIATDTGSVRLGWYTSQRSALVTLMTDFGRDRFDLLVVPSNANQASADTALTAAADAADERHAPDLLFEIRSTP
jgi:hypothetical protein